MTMDKYSIWLLDDDGNKFLAGSQVGTTYLNAERWAGQLLKAHPVNDKGQFTRWLIVNEEISNIQEAMTEWPNPCEKGGIK